ncbi:MAG: cyclic pyranopterin monophosphate synthase MoaC [Deltaproteobacteria bacterium]|nr:cyclic pyranopterin monophosphate synthase MoaC [Deltaproteobacteria bacterium]
MNEPTKTTPKTLTHLDASGQPRMVDVSDKNTTRRSATASCFISLPDELLKLFDDEGEVRTKKGPVLQTAIIAGTLAVKQTSSLIPMCHPLLIEKVSVTCEQEKEGVRVHCTVGLTGKTGVEMEALMGANVAALTIYDMCKSFGHSMCISDLRLVEKRGGKSDVG